MKKTLSVLLSIVLLLSLMTPVFAAGTPELGIKVNDPVDGKIAVDVSLSGFSGLKISAFSISVAYDKDLVEPDTSVGNDSFVYPDWVNSADFVTPSNTTIEDYAVSRIGITTGLSKDYVEAEDGVITYNFRIKDPVPETGTATFTLLRSVKESTYIEDENRTAIIDNPGEDKSDQTSWAPKELEYRDFGVKEESIPVKVYPATNAGLSVYYTGNDTNVTAVADASIVTVGDFNSASGTLPLTAVSNGKTEITVSMPQTEDYQKAVVRNAPDVYEVSVDAYVVSGFTTNDIYITAADTQLKDGKVDSVVTQSSTSGNGTITLSGTLASGVTSPEYTLGINENIAGFESGFFTAEAVGGVLTIKDSDGTIVANYNIVENFATQAIKEKASDVFDEETKLSVNADITLTSETETKTTGANIASNSGMSATDDEGKPVSLAKLAKSSLYSIFEELIRDGKIKEGDNVDVELTSSIEQGTYVPGQSLSLDISIGYSITLADGTQLANGSIEYLDEPVTITVGVPSEFDPTYVRHSHGTSTSYYDFIRNEVIGSYRYTSWTQSMFSEVTLMTGEKPSSSTGTGRGGRGGGGGGGTYNPPASSSAAVDVVRNSDDSVTVNVKVNNYNTDRVEGGVKVQIPNIGNGDVIAIVTSNGQQIVPKSLIENGIGYVWLPGTATIKAVNNAKTFTDVADNQWFKGAVDFASSHELFNGVSDTEFAPDLDMTRAMLVTVLYRLEGSPAVSNTSVSFKDVKSNVWYSNAVAWASENNIINGYSADEFGTEDQVTREQIATILHRYLYNYLKNSANSGDASLQTLKNTTNASLDRFTDKSQVSSWADEGMLWANSVGMITGRPDGTLDPTGNGTRAEVATMLMRFITALVK